MADQFAENVKRYWAIIATVVAGMIFAGNLYVALREDIAAVRSDLRDYVTERVGLLRDINGKFDDHEERLERLEELQFRPFVVPPQQ